MKTVKNKIIVIGHKNPDTDSVCSAIAYAALQNQVTDDAYIAGRAGALSKETAFVLERYGLKNSSHLILDVSPTVADMDERTVEGIFPETSLRSAWSSMRDNDVHTLPIIAADKTLDGVITLQDIALADMDSLDENKLSLNPIPVANIIEVLDGKLLAGDPDALLDKGKVVIGAGDSELIEGVVSEGDLVIVANRRDSQLAAISKGASCLVICLDDAIEDDIKELAAAKGCAIIFTKYATYKASRLVGQSIPVKYFMSSDVEAFTPSTTLDEVRSVMGRVRYNHFPVVDKEGHYHGLVSKRNLINYERKRLVLVDHNEKSQCVDGFEEATILGIIDHHRLGDIETAGPMFFRGQPLGCTATIITQMYDEAGVEIPADIAGIMCCAILSDTLAFRSPTCTALDKATATRLAAIAGENIDSLAEEMFAAGEDLSDRTPIALFNTDCKILRIGDLKIAVAQGVFYSESNLKKAISMASECIGAELGLKSCDMAFYLATSIIDKSSDVIFAGEGANELLASAFHIGIDEDIVCLPGLVSRKKQFVPAIMNTLQ